jgi:hypothetical protein
MLAKHEEVSLCPQLKWGGCKATEYIEKELRIA